MESSFAELVDILSNQKNIIMKLTDTAREHSRALRQLDTENLLSIVGREEGQTATLRRHDAKREEVSRTLAGMLGLRADASLSEFAEKAPPRYKEGLGSLLDDMTGLAGELAEINHINGILTRQALQVNQIVMKAMGTANAQVYTPYGRTRQEQQSVSLVNKKI